MQTVIDIPITPDKATKNGNIFTKSVCEKVVSQINKRANKSPIKCHFMERSKMHPIGKPAFKITGAEIDGNIKLYIKTIDSIEGNVFEQMIRLESVEYLPLIETGKDQPIIVNGIPTITEIKKFISIGVNANAYIRAQLGAQQ